MFTIRRAGRAPLVFFVLTAFAPAAPANPDIRYETEKRIVQYLAWPAQNDVLLYDLRIDRLDRGRWQQAFQTQTERPEAKISLEPGQYRYRVDVIDLLGRRNANGNWARLSVLRALQPEIASFSPTFYDIRDTEDLVLTFKGSSIEANAGVTLLSASGGVIKPESVEVDRDKEGGRAIFKKAALAEGYWTLKITNPGGLETALATLAVGEPGTGVGAPERRERGPKRFLVSEGYCLFLPLGPIYGSFFTDSMYPLGAQIRLAVLPLQGRGGSLGLELAPSWTFLSEYRASSPLYGEYEVRAQLFSLALNLFYQKKFLRRLFAFNLRAGGGVALLHDLRAFQRADSGDDKKLWAYSGKAGSFLYMMATGNAGFSFSPNNTFFIEAGADFRALFTPNTALCVVPGVSLGLSF